MLKMRDRGEQLSYVDGYNNCFRLFRLYLKEKSTDDAIASMTVVVNLINESVGKGEDDG